MLSLYVTLPPRNMVVAGCLSLHPLQEAAAQKELINCHIEAVELERELLKIVSEMVHVQP